MSIYSFTYILNKSTLEITYKVNSYDKKSYEDPGFIDLEIIEILFKNKNILPNLKPNFQEKILSSCFQNFHENQS